MKYSDDYLATQEQARAAKRGIWAGDYQVAWEYQNGNKAQNQTYANAQNCTIKGNISSNGKIYHTPNSRWYRQTKITPAKGERWFCTESEAKEAGFRKPRR